MVLLNESTLICTLGGQPQIITFALDLLLARGEAVREVVALHLSSPDGRVTRALEKLMTEFEGNIYQGSPCRFRHQVIRYSGQALAEVQSDAGAEAVRTVVHQLITNLKQTGRTLHLCISGGPRVMGLMTLSTAMLHCGHHDKVWHVYAPRDMQEQADEGAIMHDETGERVRLFQVPMVPWGAYIPALHVLQQPPAELINSQTAWLNRTEQQRCQQVAHHLSARQTEVLELLSRGYTPQEAAEALNISIKTLHSHKTVILAECRLAWELPEDSWLDYHFLREKFGAFLER
jgi:CRISPR-associated protein Csx14